VFGFVTKKSEFMFGFVTKKSGFVFGFVTKTHYLCAQYNYNSSMFQRHAIHTLRAWKNKPLHKPLIIRGARQVGKTTLVKVFATEFDTFLHLNLERVEERELFEKNDTAEGVLTAIYLHKKQEKRKGKVLLFIDEIQCSPKAVALLRYFYEDLPKLYVIAAGSLLESLIDTHISFPVGRVEYLALRPCSFAEFLDAMGETQILQALQSISLPAAIHGRMMKLFNQYVLVGGMPEAVATYAQTKDIVQLNTIYETLLNGYRDDAEKYAPNATLQKVLRHILTYGWQYAGQRIKYEKFAQSNYKSREMGEAMRTLEKALLLELSYPSTSVEFPLLADLRKAPKLLWVDTGLVGYVAGLQKELFGATDISVSWKGRIAEHVVAQELLSASTLVSTKRHFWVREAKNAQAEVDFLYPCNGHLLPVEVRSGGSATLKSLHLFMEASLEKIAIRFWNNPVSSDNVVLPSGKKYILHSIPFYYAGCLETFLGTRL
jgi:predicted AAA+ superfamily ATPase